MTNTVAKTFKILAIISLILGLISGIVLGNILKLTPNSDFNVGIMLVSWISTALSAFFIYAIGEVIQLLSEIRDNTYSMAVRHSEPSSDTLSKLSKLAKNAVGTKTCKRCESVYAGDYSSCPRCGNRD